MIWKPHSAPSRLSPFRAACADLERPSLLDKMNSRPVVATVAPSQDGRKEELDAELSGMTRSLQRRVSGLNLPTAVRALRAQPRAA